MAQQGNTSGWILDSSTGQPHMFKVVQPAGRVVTNLITSGQQVKFYKTAVPQETSQTYAVPVTSQIKGQKIFAKTVTVPMAQTQIRTSDGQLIKKYRLASNQQLQNVRLINTSGAQKLVQLQDQSSLLRQSTQNAPQQQFQQSTAIGTNPGTGLRSPVASQQTASSIYHHVSPPILDHSGVTRKRYESPYDSDAQVETKRRKTEKGGKGLRHFSSKVCEKVKEKGITSYNEVADELVNEFTNNMHNNSNTEQYDQKNIRRRVYDALNVLMAMNIISKEKKEIKWIGLPSSSGQECEQLESEKKRRIQSIREKTKNLEKLILNQISFKNLVKRNMEMEQVHGIPAPNSYIQLPFIVVSTNKKTTIDCSISQDKKEYLFKFNESFEIHDDLEVLKQIGMLMGLDERNCSPENLEKLKSLVPKVLHDNVTKMANGTSITYLNDFVIDDAPSESQHLVQHGTDSEPGPSVSSSSSSDGATTPLSDSQSQPLSNFAPTGSAASAVYHNEFLEIQMEDDGSTQSGFEVMSAAEDEEETEPINEYSEEEEEEGSDTSMDD